MNINRLVCAALAAASIALLPACSLENEFGGEGRAEFSLSVHADITRGELSNDEVSQLADGIRVYISKVGRGLLYHYQGISALPEQLPLPAGSYVAEAWAGDSVGASFTQRFYKCYTPFKIEDGAVTPVEMKCNIANAVVLVDATELSENVVPEFNFVIGHSKANLTFTRENSLCAAGGTGARGFFMMPKADKTLNWTLTGKNNGQDFTFRGTILDVQPSHEYTVRIKYDPKGAAEGTGGLPLNIVVDERELREENSTVFINGAPVLRGYKGDQEFNLTNTLPIAPATITDPVSVSIVNHGRLKSADVSIDGSALSIKVGMQHYNMLELSDQQLDGFRQNGLDWHSQYISATDFTRSSFVLAANVLKNLPNGTYKVNFDIVDEADMRRRSTLEIRVSEDKVMVVPTNEVEDGCMDIGATSALLRADVLDAGAAANARIEYRQKGATEWIVAPAVEVRAASARIAARAQGLRPGTTYEYRAAWDGAEQSDPSTFTTESPFVIPNASMELWSTYQASTMLGKRTVILPGQEGDKTLSFWGSGNEGAATAGATLTNKTSDMKHSGAYSARLASGQAAGILAAGNIFVGHYEKTDGTNGVLSLGRSYNSTHPSKLKVWVNYRPGTVDIVKDENETALPENFKGSSDQAQIYVALTTDPIEIRTNPSNRRLLKPSDPEVLAYGQVTLSANFGADGTLEPVEVSLAYNDKAKRTKPSYLIIVVSASKYGDYFSGSSSSVIYLDDFELIYD